MLLQNFRVPAVALAMAAFLLGGCARYEYQLVEPAEFSQIIPRDGRDVPAVTVPREPLEYRFAEVGHRLGVQIDNPTQRPITLLGERSYVVDPAGYSHPMRGATIAPRSRISFSLPPVQWVYRSRPRFSVGVGVGTYRSGSFIGTGFGTPLYYPYYGDPWYYDTYVMRVAPWDWREGLVRMRLVYDVARQPADVPELGEERELEGQRERVEVEHEFAFERRRIR